MRSRKTLRRFTRTKLTRRYDILSDQIPSSDDEDDRLDEIIVYGGGKDNPNESE